VLDIYRQHLDRNQVDTPELCSNNIQLSWGLSASVCEPVVLDTASSSFTE
jgi:hypothetical protein